MIEKLTRTVLQSVNDGLSAAEQVANKAVQTVQRTADVARISLRLDKEEEELGRLFYELGQAAYAGRDGLDLRRIEGMPQLLDAIAHQQEIVAGTKAELRSAKGDTCNCGAKLPDGALYCPHCGAKQEAADGPH